MDRPAEEFARQRRGRRGDCKQCRKSYTADWTSANRDRVRAASRAWRKANPDKLAAIVERAKPKAKVARKARTASAYGITVEAYDALLEAQGGGCAICGCPEDGGKALAIDHCHVGGQVRGLLCQNCNNGLGRFRDNPKLLTRAASYLLASSRSA